LLSQAYPERQPFKHSSLSSSIPQKSSSTPSSSKSTATAKDPIDPAARLEIKYKNLVSKHYENSIRLDKLDHNIDNISLQVNEMNGTFNSIIEAINKLSSQVTAQSQAAPRASPPHLDIKMEDSWPTGIILFILNIS